MRGDRLLLDLFSVAVLLRGDGRRLLALHRGRQGSSRSAKGGPETL